MDGTVDLVRDTDVGMIGRRRCLGLVEEPSLGSLVAAELFGQELEGDRAM